MAPPYQDSSPPSFPSDHLQTDHDLLFFPTTPQASSSSSSSLSFPLIFPQDHHHHHHHVHEGFFNTDNNSQHLDHHLKQEGGVIVPCNIESYDDMDQTVGNDHQETGLRFTIWKQIDKSESSSCENNDNHGLVKWAASKMRLVMNSDQTEAVDGGRSFQDRNQTSPSDQTDKRSYNNSLNDSGAIVIRTCSDCNTTKTPLWRSGPRGPKSLCNACGIRQRKARRAMAAAAEAAANGTISCGGKPAAVILKAKKGQQKAMKRAASMNGNFPQTLIKKNCKESAGAESRERKKICFEDIAISSSLRESSSAYQRVFPQDEREAAILLMTLSYGLLHG